MTCFSMLAAMRRRRTAAALSLLAVSALAGCAATEALNEQSKIDYKSINAKKPSVSLEIPPDLTNPRNDERFAIPARPGETAASAGAGGAAASSASSAGAASAGAASAGGTAAGGTAAGTATGAAGAGATAGSPTLATAQRDRGAAPRPGTIEPRLLPVVDGARIERAGNQRWLVINQPAEKVWPIVREFWQESGFIVQTEKPEAGILETDWAENRARVPQGFLRDALGKVFEGSYTAGERDKFRTRLETNAGATEVFISHRGLREVQVGQFKDTTKWEMRPSDSELEAEFLRRLMLKFAPAPEPVRTAAAGAGGGATGASSGASTGAAAGAAGGAASAAAGGAGAAGAAGATAAAAASTANDKARLVTTGGVPKVELGEGFDRAWRRVGLALDRGGFTVEDRDRSQGVYYVRYIDPEVEARNSNPPGFFSRLFSSDVKKNAQQYRIKVEGSAQAASVQVLSRDGQPVADEVDKQTAGKMLALLNEQLKI